MATQTIRDQRQDIDETAVMNKGAETRIFMQELELRKLYDSRNPTGPLPTSLRPVLNKKLQTEGILDSRAIDLTYDAFAGGGDRATETASLDGEISDEYIDYYDFLKIIGPNSISWPRN